jgi:hypothetical protein
MQYVFANINPQLEVLMYPYNKVLDLALSPWQDVEEREDDKPLSFRNPLDLLLLGEDLDEETMEVLDDSLFS